jgi:hypothetical protein
MSLAALHHCADRMAFRESVGFSAGQAYERRRIGELLRQRISDLRVLQQDGVSKRTAELLTSEIELLCNAIEREAA